MSLVPAVVLAGGQTSQEIQNQFGITNRALFRYQDRTLLQIVVAALRGHQTDSPICVIGNLDPPENCLSLPDAGSFTKNLMQGVRAFSSEPYLLVVTSDLPFLSASSVSEFYQVASNLKDADIIYPVVPVQLCKTRYPKLRRTSVGLKEGEVTGGNIILAKPAFLLAQEKRITQLFNIRKSPLRLAHSLGIGVLARLIFSKPLPTMRFSLAELETIASRLVGGTARTVLCDLPEIATDADKLEDFQILQHI